jgi:hypothetical protein
VIASRDPPFYFQQDKTVNITLVTLAHAIFKRKRVRHIDKLEDRRVGADPEREAEIDVLTPISASRRTPHGKGDDRLVRDQEVGGSNPLTTPKRSTCPRSRCSLRRT